MILFREVSFSRGAQPVFSKLSFHLGRGEYLVISGAARAGKTTIVQIITGLVLPDSGEVLIAGKPLDEVIASRRKLRELRRMIGGIGGIYSLLADRTILENVALSAEITGLPAVEARRNALEACSRYRLSHLAGKYPDSVSEIERRVALLARAEAARKSLVVADGPTDGLDDRTAQFIHERLMAMKLSGVSILYLTSGVGPQNGPDGCLQLIDGKAVS